MRTRASQRQADAAPCLLPARARPARWLLSRPLSPMLKPGGHGAIWKLMWDEGVFDWLQREHGRRAALVRQISNPIAGARGPAFPAALLAAGTHTRTVTGAIARNHMGSLHEPLAQRGLRGGFAYSATQRVLRWGGAAGTDTTLLALAGMGFGRRDGGAGGFGFMSCERAVGAAEGMNVLQERRRWVDDGSGPGEAWGCRPGLSRDHYMASPGPPWAVSPCLRSGPRPAPFAKCAAAARCS